MDQQACKEVKKAVYQNAHVIINGKPIEQGFASFEEPESELHITVHEGSTRIRV